MTEIAPQPAFKSGARVTTMLIRLVVLVLAILTLLMRPELRLPYLDQQADEYFAETMTKAGVTYGVCRIINAAISVVKESQIQVEPAGMGVSLAVGQVLDPLDDMTERASGILITAIVSLGIQKILYELCVDYAPVLIALAMVLLLAVSLSHRPRAWILRRYVVQAIIFIAVARLCLPLSAVISSYLNEHYFAQEIVETSNELNVISPQLDRLTDMAMPEFVGIWETIRNGFDFVVKKTEDLTTVLQAITQNMGSLVENLLKISYLYIALFFVEVILLPVGSFWVMTRLFNGLFGTNIPYLIPHKEKESEVRAGGPVRETEKGLS